LQLEEVSYFVEHPVPVFPPGEDMTDKPMKLFLTKREQKKLTKRNRAEKLKENRERVLLGLEPPPKPKVKISNLMRVLGSEATIDPTQVEKEVKKQMAEREQDHDSRNQARKLTKDQKYEKKMKKYEEEAKKELHVVLFLINDLSDPKKKAKVNNSARKFFLTGCAIVESHRAFVIAEGGTKAIRKFKKIMSNSIDWNADPPIELNTEDKNVPTFNNEEKMDVVKVKNECNLVWEGVQLKPNFENFKIEVFNEESAVRKYLSHHWSEHFYGLVSNYKKEEFKL